MQAATPELIKASTIILTSGFFLKFFELSITIFALIDAKFAAYVPKYSPTSSLASSQSLTAVTLAIRSPQPLAKSLFGAFFRIAISTKTPSGAVAIMEYGLSPRKETKGLAIPSCDAEVGMLTNGFFSVNAIIFAMSTDLPPPIPIIKSLLSFFISASVFSAASTSLLILRCHRGSARPRAQYRSPPTGSSDGSGPASAPGKTACFRRRSSASWCW